MSLYANEQPVTNKSTHTWSESTFGKALLDAEKKVIDRLLPQFPGNYLIKIGEVAPTAFLQASPVQQKIYFIPHNASNLNIKVKDKDDNNDNDFPITDVIQCDYAALPLLCESVDVAVIHHALEFAQNPRVILEEVAQALTPHGHLIIIGFNPKSLVGLQHNTIKKYSETNYQSARFISAKRLKEWLEQLSFTVIKYTTCYFRPFSQNTNMLRKLYPLEKLGKIFLNKLGASYIFVAEKRIADLTPIKANRLANHLSFGYLKPSPSAHTVHINRLQNP